MSVVNAYLLSRLCKNTSIPVNRGHSQKVFRQERVDQLFDTSERHSGRSHTATQSELTLPVSPSRHQLVLCQKPRNCKSCSSVGNVAKPRRKQKVLQDLSVNTIASGTRKKRLARTSFECDTCYIPICRSPACWDYHLSSVANKRQRAS